MVGERGGEMGTERLRRRGRLKYSAEVISKVMGEDCAMTGREAGATRAVTVIRTFALRLAQQSPFAARCHPFNLQ